MKIKVEIQENQCVLGVGVFPPFGNDLYWSVVFQFIFFAVDIQFGGTSK